MIATPLPKAKRILDFLLGEDKSYSHKENWAYIPCLVSRYLAEKGWKTTERRDGKYFVVFASTPAGLYKEIVINFKCSSTKSFERSYTKLFIEWLEVIEGIKI